MLVAYTILLILLIGLPILLAWYKGDAILNRLADRRQARRQRLRRKSTCSLPIRESAINSLLGAEEKRNLIDRRITDTLTSFRRISEEYRSPQDVAVLAIDQMEHILLARESSFNSYIDMAWKQSEAIELMTTEIDMLRKLAEVPPEWPKGLKASEVSPTDKLLQSMNRAMQKRELIDQKLNTIGSSSEDPQVGTKLDISAE